MITSLGFFGAVRLISDMPERQLILFCYDLARLTGPKLSYPCNVIKSWLLNPRDDIKHTIRGIHENHHDGFGITNSLYRRAVCAASCFASTREYKNAITAQLIAGVVVRRNNPSQLRCQIDDLYQRTKVVEYPTSPDVKSLAKTFFGSEDRGVLPILGDALEELGYNERMPDDAGLSHWIVYSENN